MEHIESNYSLESQLSFISICSIRIRLGFEDTIKKIKDQIQPANFANSNAPRRRAPGFLMRPATTRLKPGSKEWVEYFGP